MEKEWKNQFRGSHLSSDTLGEKITVKTLLHHSISGGFGRRVFLFFFIFVTIALVT